MARRTTMIRLTDHEELLKTLGREYFVTTVEFVPNLPDCCREVGAELGEPGQPMTVVAEESNSLKLIAQTEVAETQVDGVIKGLGVRWALKDTSTDVVSRLDSTRKRLGFCFLKDYSRTVPNVGGDEMREDAWAVTEMERLGFFRE